MEPDDELFRPRPDPSALAALADLGPGRGGTPDRDDRDRDRDPVDVHPDRGDDIPVLATQVVAEPDAFEDFFRANYAPLVRSLSVASGPERASDAVQEAFVQANLRWRHVKEMASPAAWVRRVAVNRLIDEHRKAKRGEEAFHRLSASAVAELAPADVDLADAIATLPEKQRLAVCCYYLLDLPIDEVAAMLDATPGTIKSNLHDARKRLARHLRPS